MPAKHLMSFSLCSAGDLQSWLRSWLHMIALLSWPRKRKAQGVGSGS
jgi:hypothetical protein